MCSIPSHLLSKKKKIDENHSFNVRKKELLYFSFTVGSRKTFFSINNQFLHHQSMKSTHILAFAVFWFGISYHTLKLPTAANFHCFWHWAELHEKWLYLTECNVSLSRHYMHTETSLLDPLTRAFQLDFTVICRAWQRSNATILYIRL